jgi:hypothetical protein
MDDEITIVIRRVDAAPGLGLYDVFYNGTKVADTVPTESVRPVIDRELDMEGIG